VDGRVIDPRQLLTLTFAKNVGGWDRLFRLASGGGVIAAGWLLTLPTGLSVALLLLGTMWVATGVLSRCTIYYLVGYSTRSKMRESRPT